jgi:tetratricopeptide (TPR) repeat protein
MLQPKKKISRREIKQDKLVTRAMQTEAWALAHKQFLTYVVAALAAAAILTYIWNDRRVRAEEEGATRFAKILPVYDRGDYQRAIDGVPTEGTSGLRMIVEEYGSTDAGVLAQLYYGNALAALGKYAEALEVYGDISSGDRLVASSAVAGEARCYESLQQYPKAAAAYERAAAADPKNPLAPDRLFAAAVNFSRSGDKAKAGEALGTLRKQYPTSTYVRDMNRYEAEFAS